MEATKEVLRVDSPLTGPARAILNEEGHGLFRVKKKYHI
jgi:hypothetical protein